MPGFGPCWQQPVRLCVCRVGAALVMLVHEMNCAGLSPLRIQGRWPHQCLNPRQVGTFTRPYIYTALQACIPCILVSIPPNLIPENAILTLAKVKPAGFGATPMLFGHPSLSHVDPSKFCRGVGSPQVNPKGTSRGEPGDGLILGSGCESRNCTT